MLKIIILGFWGTFPAAGGATSGFLVSTEEGNILLDCGSGIMSKLPFYTNVEFMSGVILTHLHYDHISDIGIIQYAANYALRNGKMSEKLKIFAPNEPEDIWNLIQNNSSDVKAITSDLQLRMAGAEISFMSVNHTVPCYAIKIRYQDKTLAYITDTEYMDSLISFSMNADLLICGAAISPNSNHTTGEGHMSAKEAGKLARKGKVSNLLLSHISHDSDINLLKDDASNEFGKEALLPHMSSTYIL